MKLIKAIVVLAYVLFVGLAYSQDIGVDLTVHDLTCTGKVTGCSSNAITSLDLTNVVFSDDFLRPDTAAGNLGSPNLGTGYALSGANKLNAQVVNHLVTGGAPSANNTFYFSPGTGSTQAPVTDTPLGVLGTIQFTTAAGLTTNGTAIIIVGNSTFAVGSSSFAHVTVASNKAVITIWEGTNENTPFQSCSVSGPNSYNVRGVVTYSTAITSGLTQYPIYAVHPPGTSTLVVGLPNGGVATCSDPRIDNDWGKYIVWEESYNNTSIDYAQWAHVSVVNNTPVTSTGDATFSAGLFNTPIGLKQPSSGVFTGLNGFGASAAIEQMGFGSQVNVEQLGFTDDNTSYAATITGGSTTITGVPLGFNKGKTTSSLIGLGVYLPNTSAVSTLAQAAGLAVTPTCTGTCTDGTTTYQVGGVDSVAGVMLGYGKATATVAVVAGAATLSAPSNYNKLTWSALGGNGGYYICKNGKLLGFTRINVVSFYDMGDGSAILHPDVPTTCPSAAGNGGTATTILNATLVLGTPNSYTLTVADAPVNSGTVIIHDNSPSLYGATSGASTSQQPDGTTFLVPNKTYNFYAPSAAKSPNKNFRFVGMGKPTLRDAPIGWPSWYGGNSNVVTGSFVAGTGWEGGVATIVANNASVLVAGPNQPSITVTGVVCAPVAPCLYNGTFALQSLNSGISTFTYNVASDAGIWASGGTASQSPLTPPGSPNFSGPTFRSWEGTIMTAISPAAIEFENMALIGSGFGGSDAILNNGGGNIKATRTKFGNWGGGGGALDIAATVNGVVLIDDDFFGNYVGLNATSAAVITGLLCLPCNFHNNAFALVTSTGTNDNIRLIGGNDVAYGVAAPNKYVLTKITHSSIANKTIDNSGTIASNMTVDATSTDFAIIDVADKSTTGAVWSISPTRAVLARDQLGTVGLTIGAGALNVSLDNTTVGGTLTDSGGGTRIYPCAGDVVLVATAGTFTNKCVIAGSACNAKDLTTPANACVVAAPAAGSVAITGTGTDTCRVSCM